MEFDFNCETLLDNPIDGIEVIQANDIRKSKSKELNYMID